MYIDELIFISLFYFKSKICKNTIATFIFKRNQEMYRKFIFMSNKIKFLTEKLNGISRDEPQIFYSTIIDFIN